MKCMIKLPILALIVFLAIGFSFTKLQKEELINAKDPLPSWNDGASKKSIIDFVTKTTKSGGADFVPVADRIACFDNDGTLWSEQPMYFQLAFAIDRIKAMAPQHPEWKTTQPFQALLEGDIKTALSGGEKSLMQIIATTHSGMTTEGPRFGIIVHHTDAEREWAYDRQSHIGKLEKGLDDAAKYNWLVVDMKNDWKNIYAFAK